jgi:hypothetical protein
MGSSPLNQQGADRLRNAVPHGASQGKALRVDAGLPVERYDFQKPKQAERRVFRRLCNACIRILCMNLPPDFPRWLTFPSR